MTHLNPDPHMQHYSIMTTSNADCRPPQAETVTGRDLRDFYEAYHVATIDGLELGGIERIAGGQYALTFIWAAGGIDEAAHNATHIAVYRQGSNGGWTQLGIATPIRHLLGSRNGEQVTSVTFRDAPDADAIYKVVGITRGDSRLQGSTFDLSGQVRAFRLDATGKKLEAFTATFSEGDPTFITGLGLVPFPGTLSATVSPRYCYAEDVLPVSVVETGGNGDPVFKVQPSGNGKLQYLCPKFAGQYSAKVSATWGSGGNAVSRVLFVPVRVHIKPKRLGLTFSRDGVAAGLSQRKCVQGTFVNIRWTVTGGSGPYRVWVDGNEVKQNPVTLLCGVATEAMEGFVLDRNGSGTEAMLALTSETPSAGTTVPTGNCASAVSLPTSAMLTWGSCATPICDGAMVDPVDEYYYVVRKDGVTVR